MKKHNIDSLLKFKNSQGTEVTGTVVQISRDCVVMEVYNPYSIVQLSEVISDLYIRRGERVIYDGRAVVSTLVNTGLYLVISASFIDPWKDLSGLEQDRLGIRDEARRFLADWESSHQLNSNFQVSVTEIRSLLLELSRWMEQVDLFTVSERVDPDRDLACELFFELQAPLIPKIQEYFQKFEYEASKIEPEQEIVHRKYAQRDLHPLLMRSPFLWRTFTKPLGYAGDYEMVNMMLRDPFEGPTSYSKLINALLLGNGPVIGHQNRIKILQELLSKRIRQAERDNQSIRILNVACGPAIEIQRLLKAENFSKEVEFTLLDFSDETIDYTRQKLLQAQKVGRSQTRIKYLHKSVHSLLKEAGKNQPDNNYYDIVYCAGLFDYLSDKVCNRLLRLFYQQTKKDGLVLITNVHKDNPSLYLMEFLMEWHLIYRDEKHVLNLLPNRGRQNVYLDESGTNVFLEILKSGSGYNVSD